jgi:hypothetical protein
MAFTNEQHRKRYARDAEHRAHKLAANQVYRDARRDELNALWRQKWNTDPEFRESRKAGQQARRLRKYGLTPANYEQMLGAQAGLCAICRRKPARHFCIDHCHATRVVRGLLCDACNRGLGDFGDEATRMRSAGDYLDRARGVRAARLDVIVPVSTAVFTATLMPIAAGSSTVRAPSTPLRRAPGSRARRSNSPPPPARRPCGAECRPAPAPSR